MLTDATVVLILNCCLATQKMSREAIKKTADDEYTMPLHDPCVDAKHYTSMPKVLNNPVKNVDECLAEIGLEKNI